MGFRSALFPLGLSGNEIATPGGFKSPLFFLGIAGNPEDFKSLPDAGGLSQDLVSVSAGLVIQEDGTGTDLESVDKSTHKSVSDSAAYLDDVGWQTVWPDSAPFVWYFPTDSWPHGDSISADVDQTEALTIGDGIVAYRQIDVLVPDLVGPPSELITLSSIGYQVPDTGEGTEAVSIQALISTTDTGEGVDSQAITVDISVSDSLILIETVPVTKDDEKVVADPATGFDEVITSATIAFQADVASHNDTVTVGQVQWISETVQSSESLGFEYELLESMSSNDVANVTSYGQTSEVFTGVDIVLQTLASVPGTDTATAMDGVVVSTDMAKVVGEMGAGSDLAVSSAYIVQTEDVIVEVPTAPGEPGDGINLDQTGLPPISDDGDGVDAVRVYDTTVDAQRISVSITSNRMALEMSCFSMSLSLRVDA